MRQSLWTRLMGVFLAVIVIGVITMIVAVRISTATQLQRRVLSDDIAQANSLADLLAAYYAQEGNWFGVEEWLSDASTRTASEGL